jgi:hypothetical protein
VSQRLRKKKFRFEFEIRKIYKNKGNKTINLM